jgi:hypothetical protein
MPRTANTDVSTSTPPSSLRLAGLSEVYDRLLKITRDGVLEITYRDDFPEPIAALVGGALWDGNEVDAWIAEHAEELLALFRAGQSISPGGHG